MSSKRNKVEELCSDLLQQIARKLSFPDAVSFSAVCTSWRRAAKISGVFSQPILLTIPGNQTRISNVYGSNRLSLRVRYLSKGKVSSGVANVVVSLTRRYIDSHCIGSSKGMLVLQHKMVHTGTILVNPFSGESLRLPPLTGPEFSECVCQRLKFKVLWSKAVILVTSGNSDEPWNLVLAVMCSCKPRSINYCQDGVWANLDRNGIYSDMVARERRLFVMLHASFVVEAWDFNNSNSSRPAKVMRFVPSMAPPSPIYCCRERGYLVESMGEFLLVRRLLVWGRSVEFEVYKSCLSKGEKWGRVESLRDDRTLFVGANESASVSIEDLPEGCEGNSIYFTDDHCRGKMTDGFDMGIYSMKQKKIMHFHALDDNHRLDQAAFWMIRISK